MLRLRRRIAVNLMNPTRAPKAWATSGDLPHRRGGEHHRAAATHRCSRRARALQRGIDQHIALSAINKPTACAEAFAKPSRNKNLSTSCASNQRRKSISGVLQQLRAGFNRTTGLEMPTALGAGLTPLGWQCTTRSQPPPHGTGSNVQRVPRSMRSLTKNGPGTLPTTARAISHADNADSSSLLIHHAAGLIGHQPHRQPSAINSSRVRSGLPRDLHSAGDALAKCVQTDQFSHGERRVAEGLPGPLRQSNPACFRP